MTLEDKPPKADDILAKWSNEVAKEVMSEMKRLFAESENEILGPLEQRIREFEEWKRVHTQWMNNPESLYERVRDLEQHVSEINHAYNRRLIKLEANLKAVDEWIDRRRAAVDELDLNLK